MKRHCAPRTPRTASPTRESQRSLALSLRNAPRLMSNLVSAMNKLGVAPRRDRSASRDRVGSATIVRLGSAADRLGLGGAGRAQHQRRDLTLDRIALEQKRQLATLVDLDGIVEVVGVELVVAKAVDPLERTTAGKVEHVGAVEHRARHIVQLQTDLGDEPAQHPGIDVDAALRGLVVHFELTLIGAERVETAGIDDARACARGLDVGHVDLDRLGMSQA